MTGLDVKEKNADHFYGWYKGHEIQIDREKESGNYYILVWSDAGYDYDGWWNDSADASIDEAIEEAKRRAML